MQPYYVVIRRGGKAPTVNYEDIVKACEESRRLAAQHPGEVFEVAMVFAVSQTKGVVTTIAEDLKPTSNDF